jgi:CheY-like chemotaxis protein
VGDKRMVYSEFFRAEETSEPRPPEKLSYSSGGKDMEAVLKPREILLVEDNQADITLVQSVLRRLAVPPRLSVVRDGAAVLPFLLRQVPYQGAPTPDLILLDIYLPKQTGWAVLRELRATPAFATIPVVILSGTFTPRDVQERDRLQPTQYLRKPHTVQELHDLRTSLAELICQHT